MYLSQVSLPAQMTDRGRLDHGEAIIQGAGVVFVRTSTDWLLPPPGLDIRFILDTIRYGL
jgi:hypothetical protein